MEDAYKSLKKPAEGSFRSQNSKFLAFGFPVESIEETEKILETLKKKYHDAKHHCYAYRLGAFKDVFRLNDDGEPSGTAGKPIYGQILSHNLSDVLVIVVRYFGGVLLGTGGLIQAYKSAVSDMISNAELITKYVQDKFLLKFPFEKLNSIMKIIKESDINQLRSDVNTECTIGIAIKKSMTETVMQRFSGISQLKVESW
jgi:uncharacterized YigZ family protein